MTSAQVSLCVHSMEDCMHSIYTYFKVFTNCLSTYWTGMCSRSCAYSGNVHGETAPQKWQKRLCGQYFWHLGWAYALVKISRVHDIGTEYSDVGVCSEFLNWIITYASFLFLQGWGNRGARGRGRGSAGGQHHRQQPGQCSGYFKPSMTEDPWAILMTESDKAAEKEWRSRRWDKGTQSTPITKT